MNFLYPAFLLGALAIAIPIVLHLLRRDVAPDVPFTAVRLLRKQPVERSRRRRLRDLLLLAARVTALALLAAAFARPYLPGASASSGTLRIVAVDRSFSMSAPGQFERARRLAEGALAEAGFGERVAVIAFDERAEVVALPGGAGDARAALRTLAPGHAGTRYASLLDKAAEVAAGASAKLVIVTDLQRAGWEGAARGIAPATLEIDLRDAGTPASNAALTDLRLADDRASVTVRNASRSPQRGVVRFASDGRIVQRANYDVAADASIDVAVPWTMSGASLSASIDDAQGFASDNTRHLILRRSTAPAVLVVRASDASGFYLLRALDAAGGAIVVRTVTGQEISGGRAEAIGSHAAVVLLSTRNLDRTARDAIATSVRAGGGLLIAAAPEVEPGVVASMFGWEASSFAVNGAPRRVSLTTTDVRHPVFRPFGGLTANLGQVTFQQAWQVRDGGWHVPARFSDGSPAVLDRAEGSGRVVLFASDLDRKWNDFPLHPAFVPFSVETIRYISARRMPPTELLVSQVPAGIEPAPGIHKAGDGRLVAVNVDARESGTAVMTRAEFTAMIDAAPALPSAARDRANAEQTESRQNLWQYGLLLMLLTLAAESFVGRTT